MSKSAKNPNISSIRKCRVPYVPHGTYMPRVLYVPRVPYKRRVPYVPQSIRESYSYGPLKQKYDEYIELFTDSEDSDQNTDCRNKAFNQENLVKSRKYDLKMVQTLNEKMNNKLKAPGKPILNCYSTEAEPKNIVNNPLTAKKSTPMKKISFALPDDKNRLEHERMDWKDYHPLEVIYKFMDDLEADFPSICTTVSIGNSVEGRHLKILKISNSNASNVAVWMDSGIHAREWIAPAVNTYIANHISRNFETLPESVTNKDWYFFPVVNPDGYHYSHTTNRMWRKNRANHNGKPFGVDLNRNFGVGWGGRGSSDQPNNTFYRGPYPFSEPESSAMREVLLNSGIKFQVYITLHSYGQIIIFPYSCTTEMAPDYVQLLEGATAMSKAIYNTNGETYKVGISRDVMYAASGTSNDFAHGCAGIPYCYLIELRSKKHKFKLPKEEIEDTGNEILSSVFALLKFVESYGFQNKIDQKVDLLMKKNDSFTGNCSFVNTPKSHMKQCASYNKQNYTYLKHSDSLVKTQNSYVRLTHLPGEINNFVDESSDAEWLDSINSSKSVLEKINTSEKETGVYMKSTEYSNDPPFPLYYNSFTQKTESSNDASDTNASYLDETESLTEREDSYEAWNSFYEQKNDFNEKRNYLLQTGTTALADNVQWLTVLPLAAVADTSPCSVTGSLKLSDCPLRAPPVGYEPRLRASLGEGQQDVTGWTKSDKLLLRGEFKATRSASKRTGASTASKGRGGALAEGRDRGGPLRRAINIWKEERSSMDIMVAGARTGQVAGLLNEKNIPYTIAIMDLTTLLNNEQQTSISINFIKSKPKTMDWNNYHTLDTIYAFLDSLQAEYPYLCSVHVIGKSVEGRDLKMLKISNGDTNPGVWLDGAIHPREWISPAVVTYLANRIVRSFNEMPESVTNKDWYILPVMNPDGYAYTHTHDRMWRKNRARYGELVGVDLNRNFSYGFGEKGEEGSSNDPGSVFYRGPKAFSEPETAAVRRAITNAPTKFKAFLSFHSYGEVIIFPWGYTSDACPDYVDLLEGGTAMAKAIYGTSGHTYKVGSTKDLMYYAAGTSIDWSYAVPNIQYSYMIELRSKTHRFLLPKEEIITTANEIEHGVFRLMAFIDQRCTGTQTCACPK